MPGLRDGHAAGLRRFAGAGTRHLYDGSGGAHHPIQVHVRGDTGDDLTIVSAADAKYFERLSNFIGSVHFWEPFLHIDIYDLGLAPEQLTHVQEWDRTSLFKTSYTDIPLVGWKFAVVLDALTRHEVVLWMDANAELRRPLTAIRHSLNERATS